MNYYEVAPNQIVRADSAFFTYSSKEQLHVGQIVSIEIGKKHMTGIVLRKTNKPNFETKSIKSIIG
ncbi:MAG: hypothetical protein PHY48_16260, partial [Candidatus Cloacimonetes bacterium]|nr:hypothetical protein [Candidatus Cloacimonadota bacterium]